MKNIKFKIYDKELKESHIEDFEDLHEDDIWYDGETEIWNVLYDCNNEQERFVALQYIGLKDKNGVEIYEGNILKYIDNGKEKIDYIVYQGNMFTYRNAIRWNLQDDEIIGNIYDNPELIGG